MSVPNWLNDAPPLPNGDNGDNGAFNAAGDPSTAFLQTPTSASFDPSQLQYSQMQHRMQNGVARNASPASHPQMYPTQNVVPSKRPRPREDSIGASPQQYSGGLPTARSQTPQGAYPGYQGSVNGGPQYPGSYAYPQFQQASNHSTPSSMMQTQLFNTQGPNPGTHAMSPSPFSPAAQTFGAQTTPPQSDHGSRVNTPQGGGQTYPQNLSYGASQAGASSLNAGVNGSANPHHHNPQNPNPQRMYEASKMRQLQQAQANGMTVPQRQSGPLMNAGVQPMNPMQNYQMAQARQQAQVQAQAAQTQQRPNDMDQMMRRMVQFMQARGIPFNPQPMIASRAMNCVHIFMCGMKMGGSRNIQGLNRWPQVAQMLSVPQPQLMVAAQELQAYWNHHLLQWEHHWQMQSAQSHQQQQQQQQRQRAMAESARTMHNPQSSDPALRQGSFSPTKPVQDLHGQRLMQPPAQIQNASQNQAWQGAAAQPDPRQALQNGHRMQQQAQLHGIPPNAYGKPAPSVRHGQGQVSTQQQLSPSTVKSKKVPARDDTEGRILLQSPHEIEQYYTPSIHPLDPSINPRRGLGNVQNESTGMSNSDINAEKVQLSKSGTRPEHHGGLPVSNVWFQDTLHTLLKYKHTMPQLSELGVIDIRALTLSVKSGICGEVRLALDVIAALSHETPLPLNECDELLDSLIDCANEQIDLLADGSHKTSDTLQIPSYEEQVRGVNTQSYTLQAVTDVGSRSYELERAADRLICITTILRNLAVSPMQGNYESLREPNVFRMITVAIRYLGTRKLFLRTHQNALDFGKDVVVFFSTVAPLIHLTSKDEALSILHFLLSFAPEPSPNSQDKEISFANYVPDTHRYFPHAIDSLAKLLAQDPNRTLYRSIFASDSAASPPFDLLTRAFGLSIAAIPDVVHHRNQRDAAVVCNATFAQGLLSAGILISMIPATERSLAHSWLRSQDSFALKLMATLSTMAHMAKREPERYRDGRILVNDESSFRLNMINVRGLVVMTKLVERAQDAEAFVKDLSSGVLPLKRTIIQALESNSRSEGLRQLLLLTELER